MGRVQDSMLRRVLLVIITLIILTGCNKYKNDYESAAKFDPSRDAARDIAAAVIEAGKENKNILLDVGGEWCIWCHRLDAFIKENDELNNYLHDNFIVVKINYSPENKNEKVLSKYPQVAGYPHLFVLSKEGEFLHSQNTGDLEFEKSYDLNKMMTFLKKWSQ